MSATRLSRLATVAVCSLALAAAPLRAQTSDPELAAGVRQVREGDFETAIQTLEAVVRRLALEPGRSRDLAQAHLYLGVAHVALGHREPALASFREALKLEPDRRLRPDEFSPKVIGVFEEARREAKRAAAAEGASKKRGSKTPWILGGIGAAAAAGIAVAAGGGGTKPGPGSVTFTNARFGTPVLVCPDDVRGMPLAFNILVEGANTTSSSVTISAATAVLIIVASSIPSEIEFGSSLPAAAMPATISSAGRTTVRVESTLLCDNGPGDSARFNEWSGRVTLTTSAGVFTVEAADRLRVNIP